MQKQLQETQRRDRKVITYTIWLSRERRLGAVTIGSAVRAGPASLTRRDDGTLECKCRMDMRQRANSSLPSREVKESYEKLGGQGRRQGTAMYYLDISLELWR